MMTAIKGAGPYWPQKAALFRILQSTIHCNGTKPYHINGIIFKRFQRWKVPKVAHQERRPKGDGRGPDFNFRYAGGKNDTIAEKDMSEERISLLSIPLRLNATANEPN
jgi:hypothetical protein